MILALVNWDIALIGLGVWLLIAILTSPFIGKAIKGREQDLNLDFQPLEDRPQDEWSEYLLECAERRRRAMKRYGRAA